MIWFLIDEQIVSIFFINRKKKQKITQIPFPKITLLIIKIKENIILLKKKTNL